MSLDASWREIAPIPLLTSARCAGGGLFVWETLDCIPGCGMESQQEVGNLDFEEIFFLFATV